MREYTREETGRGSHHPWMQAHLARTRGFRYRSMSPGDHTLRDRIYITSLLLRGEVRFTSACSLLRFLRSVSDPLVLPLIYKGRWLA